jgi:nucleotide-binding universal stress UspA family protein
VYDRILVPLDGSQTSERILPHAIAIAQKFGAVVVLLQALTSRLEVLTHAAGVGEATPTPVDIDTADEVRRAEADAAERYFAAIGDRLTREGIPHEKVIVEGFAVSALAEAVREQRIDLVAMTTHARSALGRIFFGSVAASLLEQIDVPVLLLHAEEKQS